MILYNHHRQDMPLGAVRQQKQLSLFILTLIGLLDLDGVILIMAILTTVTAIHIIHITDGAILATAGADTQVMVGVDTRVMATTILTQHLMLTIMVEEVLIMAEITIELLLTQETLLLAETVSTAETA